MRYTIIDTISITLRRIDCNVDWNITNIAKELTHYSFVRNSVTNETYVRGWHANFRVYLSNDILKLEGSLPKYYYGSNIKTLTFEDAILAIESLSFDFGLPFERGYIKRIDIGRNIIVRKQVKEYLDAFDETKGFFRDRTTNRLLYKTPNQQIALSMYDKQKELKRNDREIFEYTKNGFLKNKNLLRYELQITQRANKQLGYKSLRVVLLRSKTFVKKLNDIWFKKYKSIYTKKKFAFGENVNSYGELQTQLLIFGVQKFGPANLFEVLNDLRKRGNITASQKRYAIAKINNLIKTNGCLIELDHVEELNKQMEFLHQDLSSADYDNLENLILNPKPKNKQAIANDEIPPNKNMPTRVRFTNSLRSRF